MCDYISFLVHPGAVVLKSCKRFQQQSLQFDNTTFMGFIGSLSTQSPPWFCFDFFIWSSQNVPVAVRFIAVGCHCSFNSLVARAYAKPAVCATRLHWSPEPILSDSCSPNIQHPRWKFAQRQLSQQRHLDTNWWVVFVSVQLRKNVNVLALEKM